MEATEYDVNNPYPAGKLQDEIGLERIKALYDEEILEADAQVGALVNRLKENGLYDRSFIIITSDHGEVLGEHGALFHGEPPYEEQIHVPPLPLSSSNSLTTPTPVEE